MRLTYSNRRNDALTRVEVVVVVVAGAFLILIFFAALRPAYSPTKKVACEDNLKQIGIAFRIWSGDCGDKYPTQVSVKQGGAMELIAKGDVAALFQVMSNELSTPKVLVCPNDDTRRWAMDFTTNFGRTNISYFVGLDAADYNPCAILSGDDNLAIQAMPAKSGVLGLPTNQPVTWTIARHHFKGNILLTDGSVTMMDNSSLTQAITNQYRFATDFTNRFRIAIP